MKKIGLISLALVLALGALGVAYAPWTDQVEISQVVHTGSLEVGVYGTAELIGDTKEVAELEVTHGEFKFNKADTPFYDSVTVSIGNLYPCVEVHETFYIGVGGTVPVHLYASIEVEGDWDEIAGCMDFSWEVDLPNGDPYSGVGIRELIEGIDGIQVYPCDTITITIYKHLLQCGGLNQGLEGSFTLTVIGYQYNYDPNNNS